MIFDELKYILKSPNELALLVLRVIIGLMWLSEAFIKIIKRSANNQLTDYNNFLSQLHQMADTNPFGFVSQILNNLLIPNYILLLILVVLLEIGLGVSVIAGVFSRIGSVIGIVYALILYIATLGWGDWPWSYFMIIMAMLVVFISGFQMRIGLDFYLHTKYKSNKLTGIFI